MTDVDFCKEYVRRIPHDRRTRYASNIHMTRIVGDKQSIPLDDMFPDIHAPFGPVRQTKDVMDELFGTCDVHKFVYRFIRDNQSLFIEE